MSSESPPIGPPIGYASLLLVDQAGRYLMQLRDDIPGILYPGCWGLFGGGIEPGETAEVAMRRELEEEIGFVPDVAPLFRVLRVPTRIDASPTERGPVMIRRVAVFEGRIDAAQVPSLRQGEGAARALWPPELLLLETNIAVSARLAVALHSEPTLGQCTAPMEQWPA
jgi:8-oxo-dGTP pyrophosphatase MutT (NUDIX family)